MEPQVDSPEGVSFLTALLVRYPELGSASLCQGGSALRLDFYLTSRLEDRAVEAFAEHVRLSWQVFFGLQRLRPSLALVQRSDARRGEAPWMQDDEDGPLEVDSLQFLRDLETVSVEEFRLLVALVREAFGSDLALNEEAPGDDPGQQDEMIHRTLEKVRAMPGEASLTGFRDDMRVLIYASQELD